MIENPDNVMKVQDLLRTNKRQAFTKDEIKEVTGLRVSEISDALGDLMVHNQIRLIRKRIDQRKTAVEIVWAVMRGDRGPSRHVQTQRASGKVTEIDDKTIRLRPVGGGHYTIRKDRIMRERLVSAVVHTSYKLYYAWRKSRR